MAYDVFISYASNDKPTADAACATLEARGIRCWIAPRDILVGTEWGEAIIDAIHQSQVMVLVFSSRANESPHIKREVDRAVTKGVPIIPVRIEDVVPVKALEYYISSVHWLDAFTPPLEAHLNRLADKVQVLLGRRADDRSHRPPFPPVPLPTPPRGTRLPVGALAAAFVVAAIIGAALWLKPWSPSSRAPSSPVSGKPEVTTRDDAVARPPDATELQRLVSQKLGEQGFRLKVDVSSDQIVALTGTVPDLAQRDQAIRLVKAMPGVKEVRPEIAVAVLPPKTKDLHQSGVERQRQKDQATGLAKGTTGLRDVKPNIGAAAGAPDRGEIERLVLQNLSKNGLRLRVDVGADGIVTLTGVVRNQEEKALAMNVAKVPGVKGVRPQINVQEKWQLQ
jgi:osmotically-inducible protein OsmY